MVFFAGDLAVQTKGVHKVRVESKRGGGGVNEKIFGWGCTTQSRDLGNLKSDVHVAQLNFATL